MPNNNSSSSSSANQGDQSKAPHKSTYRLAKDAGYKSPYHAGISYGIKMYDDGAYDEIRTILQAIDDQVQDENGDGGYGSAKK
ncbi:hypothetical protein E0Z10_g5895 [Xylaria hypoxylon]|uniref:Uncharacterized protein n=1 Tax=Xylaria hypoxylon TaxID=37992 RepID=A0A4Z0YS69_9PEZI|nr:hypothetical protein E0Z10_g5895 [Xylaria hypoxylon]